VSAAASPPGPSTPEPWTVRRILEWTTGYLKENGSETPRLDAEILLAHARKTPRIKLYTEFDEVLTDAVRATMRDMVKRRANREPVAYLVGHREFFSLSFEVAPGVFIPRPDTETLVMETLSLAKGMESPSILELCAGSGCVCVSLAVNLPSARLTAVELEPIPLAIAQKNAEKHKVRDRIDFRQGNLFEPVPAGTKFDFVVSNPPYVADGEIPGLEPEISRHEPRAALAGGADGLEVIRRLAEQTPQYLKPGGSLLFELSPEQVPAAKGLFEAKPDVYDAPVVHNDMAGLGRVIRVRRKSS
jgi:release factor glutamine methyltransferase